VAEIMAGELEWDRAKVDAELGLMEEIYRRRS
jgi:hypothetical protein